MTLQAADQAAQQLSATDEVGSPVRPCPLHEKRERIEVQVQGEDKKGLAAIALVLANGKTGQLSGVTAADGYFEFDGLDPGTYQLSLCELDQDAWTLIEQQPLTGTAAVSHATAVWQPAEAAVPGGEFAHTIVQGECVAEIAEMYGFFPETIWHHGANAKLREQRASLYILFPEDQVKIPAKRIKTVPAATSTRLIIRRKGVPERLRIRFLRHDDTPRAGLPYLLSVETRDHQQLADIRGETDAGGFVDAPIPPGATFAEIVLGRPPGHEVHQFNLGYVDPVDSISGWQARLNNLGYRCGAEDGILGERTREAISAFQRSRKLPETGKMDDATKAALLGLALS